nr:uncharacterized protein LOC124808812 [Hydra vulgaris]
MKYIKFRVRPNKRTPLQPLENPTSGTDSDAFTALFLKPLTVKCRELLSPLCFRLLIPMYISTPISSKQHVDKNQSRISPPIISNSCKSLKGKVSASVSVGPKKTRANSQAWSGSGSDRSRLLTT